MSAAAFWTSCLPVPCWVIGASGMIQGKTALQGNYNSAVISFQVGAPQLFLINDIYVCSKRILLFTICTFAFK